MENIRNYLKFLLLSNFTAKQLTQELIWEPYFRSSGGYLFSNWVETCFLVATRFIGTSLYVEAYITMPLCCHFGCHLYPSYWFPQKEFNFKWLIPECAATLQVKSCILLKISPFSSTAGWMTFVVFFEHRIKALSYTY